MVLVFLYFLLITAHNLREIMPSCTLFLVNNLSRLDSVPIFIQRFSTFCFNCVCYYKILDEVCKKDVMLNLNGKAGCAIFSVS